MGKKHVVVGSSSDDEEGGRPRSTRGSNSSKSKSRWSVPRVNLRSSKRTRISESFSSSCKEFSGVEEIGFDSLDEDFYECLRGFKVVSGREGEELWVDKYKPRSLGELAVHRKKVEEVKTWLEEHLKMSKENFHSHTLLIAGQAGVGKSATVHVIASHLGVSLCEWNTPTPTLWQEHMHNANSGIQYVSKLDEFQSFVERIRKYPLLPLASTEGSNKPAILLVDDLPLTNGRVAYGRLSNCLHVLARSTQIPTVILITEYGKADTNDPTKLYWEELKSSLENAGASKVSFNPVTVNSIKKMLSRICKEEQCSMTDEHIDQIAKSSGGDIRHAITSLQYLCLRPNQLLSLPSSTLSTNHSNENSKELSLLDDRCSLAFGRDETLSLFHALGKFLHNKRETFSGADLDILHLREKFARLPLKMEAPEKILDQAHGKARSIADFLHENVLDFISDQAVDDAWAVSSYLSDADCLLASSVHQFTWSQMMKYERESIGQEVAASVAARGVLFGNSHPSPSRWHSIRSPKLWQVEQSSRKNKNEMLRRRSEAYNSLSSSDINVMVTEYLPVWKWLGLRTWEGDNQELEVSKMEEDYSDRMSLDNLETDNAGESEGEDEIEDW
ncbi:cell cycle checkpoint protein RAD17 isoform X2 [Telopea speciosissima]|uniref:cell cycle checkpoint protein RAD17 isoform X2 n=1 Tax=Telopea speciosissima TaxID=54955 RepID=UPI001CC6CDB6|nr:cell cycle checkpoint protein RAD17 isoform X2 [Telopea speciosissima]